MSFAEKGTYRRAQVVLCLPPGAPEWVVQTDERAFSLHQWESAAEHRDEACADKNKEKLPDKHKRLAVDSKIRTEPAAVMLAARTS